ncbi:membrane-anchored ubiquitin-fold protein 6 isoform X3 [Cannabis sativa]|uniref:membrane-anchored ubiquitin-fold protein 6 isoform X3 n=1 Tax=Cannabis sativa TaxID=3483 RepID=UPI0029CA68A5|nr:membrane-anchored ubiquitin-fold protein 6 isoform X3 [Cannabis sativa]
MAAQDLIEVKFRLSDGTDIGPSKYSPSVSVASLKEKILAQWPKGKILENNRTLAESKLPVDLPGGVITMHVVVRPPLSEKNPDKVQNDLPKKNMNRCGCSIL